MALFKVDRRVWLNADRTKVLEDGHPDAAFLLYPAGAEVPMPDAIKHGLAKAADKPADKMMSAPANKGRKA